MKARTVKGERAMEVKTTQKPTGEVAPDRSVENFLANEGWLDHVLSKDNMHIAWRKVKANKGASGVDEISIADTPAHLRVHWDTIRQSIFEGCYRPKPVRRVEIPKRSGGSRSLGIPTTTDRLIQQAVAQPLTSLFDPNFSESSFGFRPGRSAHGAVLRVREMISKGYVHVVNIDLSRFFDNVEHEILMDRLRRKVHDRKVLRLIHRYLKAGVEEDGRMRSTYRGVPQGGPLSPLLANIVLDDLDKELEMRGHAFVRYSDDFVILKRSRRAAERVMRSIGRFLERKLKLPINEKKSGVCKSTDLSYLGFRFHGKKIRWTDDAYEELRHRLRRLTARSWGVSMNHRYRKLSEYLRGWMRYFQLSEYYRPIPILDEWLRRRIRMCYWKQWRRCRKRVQELLKEGVSEKQAILTALSRKSYWRLSKTYATQMGMSNAWLKAQGLVSIKDLWSNLKYPATAR